MVSLTLYKNFPADFPADLVTFTEEILNGKLHFLGACQIMQSFIFPRLEFY